MTDLQIKYFVEAVLEGSITAAARKLYISQPTVTTQISAFEKECGLKLLKRHSNGVVLTDAGRILFNCLQRLRQDWNTSIGEAHEVASGQKEHLSLGYLTLSSLGEVQSRLRQYVASHTDVLLDVFYDTSIRLIQGIMNGTVDLAVLFDVHVKNYASICTKPILRSEYIVVMAPDHPLASATAIRPDMIADCRFIFSHLGGDNGVTTYDNLCSAASQLGINPDLIQHQPNFESIFPQIEMGNGLTVVDEHVDLLQGGRFRTFPTGLYHNFVLAWKAGNRNMHLKSLREYLNNCIPPVPTEENA